ncbi:lysophospholipid acyltransferase family protein [Flavobacterium sp. MK4S-17]|uniref:lysophospholipid acyltransferase family protein n=1 Tax=Flavobacterium sp. MK4S-17 TaxID=2543737 RepID=UPI00351AE255
MMQFLAYIIAYPFLWIISILPFRLLYILSDVTYFFIYTLIGYRKKTVRLNLELALPHLNEKERREVEKKFYHHFCDSLFEMIKTLNIRDEEIKKRFTFTNFDLVHEYEAKGKSVVVLIGHYGSYEWLLVMNRYLTTHQGFGIYKVIRNKYFNRLVKKIRGKFNARLIGMKSTIPTMRKNERDGVLGFYGFITDQSPKIKSAYYWSDFFGMEVPVHVGGEIMAKKLGMNIMFARVEKTARGYYKCTYIPVEENIKDIPNFEITDRFMAMLEEQIKQKPEYYLWTHNRFKHRKNNPPHFKA